jgi:gliding motility-associated-like protein
MKNLLFVLLACVYSLGLWGQTLEGATDVCQDRCYTYRLQPADAEALWEITDPDGLDVPFSYIGDSTVIEVCFSKEGAYTLSVAPPGSGGGSSITVFSGTFTDPVFELFTPAGCENPWLFDQNCVNICYGQEVVIRPRDVVFDTLQWSVSGPAEIIQSNNSEIRLRLDSMTGNVFIGYFGTSGDRCLTEGGKCIRLIAPPTPEIGSAEFGIIEDSIEICQGQLVNFENASDAPVLSWGLSSGSSGDAEGFRYRFSTPGEYQLTLSVGLDCSCTAEKMIKVLVNPTPIPEIQCVSAVCAGDTALYETQVGCAPYQWRVEGMGAIVSGGETDDNFMEVHWTGGSEGWVELEHNCADACPLPARERIEILGPGIQIEGRSRICPDEIYTYSVPQRDGTQFNWDANGGAILGGGKGSRVQVQFNAFTPNPYISVEIEDCTRGCVQRDTLLVTRVDPFELTGPTALCFGEEGNWATNSTGSNVSSFWLLKDPDGATIDSTTAANADYSFTFSQPGRYTLEARPELDNYCFPRRKISIAVRPSLPEPGAILGADTICPGNSYWYEGDESTPSGMVREWVAIQGQDTIFETGNTLRLTWQGGVDKSLLTFFRDVQSGCTSDISEIELEEIGGITIQGPDTLCRGLEGLFHLRETLSDEVSWTLNANSGARVTDQIGLDSVRVLFSEAGVVELTASICGRTATQEVFVSAPPPIDLDALESVGCGIDVTTREVDGSLYDSIFWYENGLLVSTAARTELRRGQRNMLIVSSPFDCRNRAAFSIPFTDFVRPEISSLNSPVFCNGGQATLVHDIAYTTDLDIAWYRDSTLIAENVDTVLVTTTGYYQLELTQRSTGCVIESDLFLLCESCDPDPDSTVVLCPLIAEGNPNEGLSCDPSLGDLVTTVDFFGGRCDQIQLTANAPDMISGTAVWRVDLESGFRLFFGDTISFEADQNGRFRVYNVALGINAMGDTTIYCPQSIVVEVPGTLDATASLACLGDSTVFNPNIELIASASITNLQWNFGDGTPGSVSSEIMPRFRYASVDSFSATVEIQTSASCTLLDTVTAVVFQNPAASWVGNSTACTRERYEVEALGSAAFYDWRFGNPLPDSSQAIGPTSGYRYDSAGTFDIQLTVEDLLGCTQDSLQSVLFNAYSGPDSIAVQPELPACAGDWVDLSVSGSFSNLLWSNGSTGAQITADQAGPYSLEVTDDNGCKSDLGPVDIEYETAPNVLIRANPLQGEGRYNGDTLEVCYGQAVELRLLTISENYILSWSVGGNLPILRYDGNASPILNEGFYEWELTVTDTTTNCDATDAFYVLVHPQPDVPIVSSNQSPPYCAGDMIELRVDNPAGSLDYTWNTGDTGESITASTAQPYSVRAVNAFGCEAESAPFVVNPLPDVGFFPLGCYAECGDVEICLPLPEGHEIVEWTRNGVPQTIPTSLLPLSIDSSGYYAARVRNAFGCEAQTDSIRFDIFYDAGLINGFVFLDRNSDGSFNMSDSLLSGLKILLIENGLLVDSTLTDTVGGYAFNEVPFGNYQVMLDSSSVPANWNVVVGLDSALLTDCGQELELMPFILEDCPSVIDSVELTACSGDSLLVDGQAYRSDTVVEIMEVVSDCPEVTVYELFFFPGGDTTVVQELGCTGDTIDFAGMSFSSDTVLFQNLANQFGCDSTVAVEIRFENEPQIDSLLSLCPGDSVQVDGRWYRADTSFSYVGTLPGLDCDVQYNVEIRQVSPWDVSIETEDACPGAADGSALLLFGNRDVGALRSIRLGGLDSVQTEWRNLTAGSFALSVEDTSGCTYEETLTVGEREAVQIQIPDATIGCEGDTAQLEAIYQGGDSTNLRLEWEGGISGRNLIVDRAGAYRLQVETACESKEVLGRVRLDLTDPGSNFFVPNVFSPNQDGINDVFLPIFSEPADISSYQLQVFDRWGKMVFESRDPMVGWNGRVKEQLMNPGVYVWRMEWVGSACGGPRSTVENGSVSLVR